MEGRPLAAVLLAAGQGTRMRSQTPKPLHPLCGRAMVLHALDAAAAVPVDRAVVVVGHGGETVAKQVQDQAPPDLTVELVDQMVQRGTGDAALVALTAFQADELDEGDVLMLPGDAPLLRATTLRDLVALHRRVDAAATLLTAVVPDPSGYGRVLRTADGAVSAVVEEVDASPEERTVTEVNTSVYCFRLSLLAPALRRLRPDNAAAEYYLTDVVHVLRAAGHVVAAATAPDHREASGVNDRAQLAEAEAELRARVNHGWMATGVTLVDPGATYIDVGVRLAPDVTVLPGSLLGGRTTVGRGARVGPGAHLIDTDVGEGAVVETTTATEAEIGPGAVVGPYAVLAPGAVVPAGARTGAFYTSAPDGGS